ILDEPSIGLHTRDTMRLIRILRDLCDLGNTVVVVEHDSEVMRGADYIVDMGPGAGEHGGQVVFAGPATALFDSSNTSLTSRYLRGEIHTARQSASFRKAQKAPARGALRFLGA